ncbi:nitrous oxide reductase family maturation protein NosD [Alkalimarinus alittae]|uniref:Nitrous oxide reductase family maturation protein NosD n=1 Tax=Alkalimarinus alittae TaxID=2961619 RepID=A0ABY6N3P0_9ALTE|nr:nitrous oxide reductase family maturation protein NosD [Alkalimarinus alittae]UZE96726.1 nitrous oxide reductase family maturation protein NosD [Alkalimarinus alittae]
MSQKPSVLHIGALITYSVLTVLFSANLDANEQLSSAENSAEISDNTTRNITVVSPTNTLQKLIDEAQNGDTLQLRPGRYIGSLLIDKPLTLNCEPGTNLDANKTKDAIRITAPNVTVKGCNILNWGDDLTAMDAGIIVKKTAENAVIKNNYLKGVAFGIFLDSSVNTQVLSNRVEGSLETRSQDRGNGIHLYGSTGADVAFNEVWHTRDGIYIDTSHKNSIRNNEFHHLRYGVHYMYSYSNLVENNYTHHTRTGYALMQSKYLQILNNRSEWNENYGILLNYITDSTIKNNHVSNTRQGSNYIGDSSAQGAEGKALFIYNSFYNKLVGNTFREGDLGIHITAGSEDNIIIGNNFIGNKQQVKYVSTRTQEWSNEGAGNFWSDYLGWDRDSNGVGDIPYEPNDGVDKMLWKYPSAKVLMNSPAVETLRWIQREFPVLKSPGVTDSYPLMRPTESNNILSPQLSNKNQTTGAAS